MLSRAFGFPPRSRPERDRECPARSRSDPSTKSRSPVRTASEKGRVASAGSGEGKYCGTGGSAGEPAPRAAIATHRTAATGSFMASVMRRFCSMRGSRHRLRGLISSGGTREESGHPFRADPGPRRASRERRLRSVGHLRATWCRWGREQSRAGLSAQRGRRSHVFRRPFPVRGSERGAGARGDRGVVGLARRSHAHPAERFRSIMFFAKYGAFLPLETDREGM